MGAGWFRSTQGRSRWRPAGCSSFPGSRGPRRLGQLAPKETMTAVNSPPVRGTRAPGGVSREVPEQLAHGIRGSGRQDLGIGEDSRAGVRAAHPTGLRWRRGRDVDPAPQEFWHADPFALRLKTERAGFLFVHLKRARGHGFTLRRSVARGQLAVRLAVREWRSGWRRSKPTLAGSHPSGGPAIPSPSSPLPARISLRGRPVRWREGNRV